jgi:hypothetical protein
LISPTMPYFKPLELVGENLLNELNMAIEQEIRAILENVEIKELLRTLKDDFIVTDN